MHKDLRFLPEKIHMEAYGELTSHLYGKRRVFCSERYTKGRITALRWLCELGSHYLDREKELSKEILFAIRRELDRIEMMDNSPYRAGLKDAVEEILDSIRIDGSAG